MATFRKRGNAWQAGVVRLGQRRVATFDTHAEAETWAIATEAALMAAMTAAPVAQRPVGRHDTVESLMDRYRLNVSPTKGGKRWEATRLRTWPSQFLLFAGPVSALDGPALADWRDKRLLSVKSSTVNRELNLLSAIMNTAIKEWRVPGLTVNPAHLLGDLAVDSVSWLNGVATVGLTGGRAGIASRLPVSMHAMSGRVVARSPNLRF